MVIIDRDSVLTRKSGHREARRLAMYCVSTYSRQNHSLSEMAKLFSVSASALTQAKDSVANNSSQHFRKVLNDLRKAITKT